jgi:hypothetical protein
MVCVAQTMHYLQRERIDIAHDPRHLGVVSAVSKTIFEPMVCSTQIMHLSSVKFSTIAERTEMSFRIT